MKTNLNCCEYFENEIRNKFLEKLGFNKNEIENPNVEATAISVSSNHILQFSIGVVLPVVS